MAGVCDRRVHGWQRGRDGDAEVRRRRERTVAARRPDACAAVSAGPRGRGGVVREPGPAAERHRLPERGGRPRRAPSAHALGDEDRIAARAGQQRPGLTGRQGGAADVPDQRRPADRRRSRRARARSNGRRSAGASETVHRRVRRRQRQQGHQRAHLAGLPEGRDHLAPGDAVHPRARVRRAGGSRRAAAAGHHRGARGTWPDLAVQPSAARRSVDPVGDPADRFGGRRRLLAVLSAP